MFYKLNRVFLHFQHTLVTEIRELVYPEDRTRYDELVYRRETYSTDRDRHRVMHPLLFYSFSAACLTENLPFETLSFFYIYYTYTFSLLLIFN